MKVSLLKEIRKDGKIISEDMTIEDIASLGLPPEKIVSIEWSTDGRTNIYKHDKGIVAKVLPDRTGIALLLFGDKEGGSKELKILNADGSIRLTVNPEHNIDQVKKQVTYLWFEKPKTLSESAFGVVFADDMNKNLYQLDIDSASGKIINIYSMQ